MKKVITIVLFVLAFSINANAQEKKKGPQADTKKELCCADHKNATAEEMAKCKEKKAACATDTKSTDKKSCKPGGSCCAAGGKAPAKKS
jgi:hypothetical protein